MLMRIFAPRRKMDLDCPHCHGKMVVEHIFGFECLLCGAKFNQE